MAHWYRDGGRYLRELARKAKDGRTHTEQISIRQGLEAGAVLGVTDILSQGLPTPFGLRAWTVRESVRAGLIFGLGCELGGGEPSDTAEKLLDNAVEFANNSMGEYADRGSQVHQAIMSTLEGKEPTGLSPEEVAEMHKTLATAINVAFTTIWGAGSSLNVSDSDDLMIERPFAWDCYGGTPDIIVRRGASAILLDWKTCQKEREPYETELAQEAAYSMWLMNHAHLEKVYVGNVYINANDLSLIKICRHDEPSLLFGWSVFKEALSTLSILAGYCSDKLDALKLLEPQFAKAA